MIHRRILAGLTVREESAGQLVVTTFAAILMAVGVMELLLVVGAIAAGWAGANHLEALPRLLAALAGLWSAIATINMSKTLIPRGMPLGSRLGAPTEARAGVGLALAIGAVLLIWPLGILLGPAALWVSLAALGRIKRAGGDLSGFGMAASAAILGCSVCGMYLFVLAMESAAVLTFGDLIPAPP